MFKKFQKVKDIHGYRYAVSKFSWLSIYNLRSFYIDLYMYAYIILELWKKNVFFIHNRTPEIVHKSTTAVIHSAFIVLWGIDRIIRLGNRKSYIVVFVRVLLLSSAMVYVQESWSAQILCYFFFFGTCACGIGKYKSKSYAWLRTMLGWSMDLIISNMIK